MNLAYLILTGAAIVANSYATVADFAKLGFVVKTADQIHVSRSWLPLLGALKGAAVVGLLLGLFGEQTIGIAAAGGLVVYFIGAMVAHVGARVFHNIAYPIIFLAIAIGCFLTSLSRASLLHG